VIGQISLEAKTLPVQKMEGFIKLFGKTRSVVFGMVHLNALPGKNND